VEAGLSDRVTIAQVAEEVAADRWLPIVTLIPACLLFSGYHLATTFEPGRTTFWARSQYHMLISDRPADLETWQRTGMILDTPGSA